MIRNHVVKMKASGAPSILNISSEATAGGGLAYLQTGDAVRIDLNQRHVNHLVPQEEWERRIARANVSVIEPQTWWQQLFQQTVDDLGFGAVFPEMTHTEISAINPRGTPTDLNDSNNYENKNG